MVTTSIKPSSNINIALVSAMYGRSSELGLYQTYTSAHPFDTLVSGLGGGGRGLLLQNADSSAAAWSRSLKSYLGQFQNYSPQLSALCTLLAGHNFDKPAEESFRSQIQCNSDQNVPAQFLTLFHPIPYNCHFFYTDTIFGE